jgi:hypothetical protein
VVKGIGRRAAAARRAAVVQTGRGGLTPLKADQMWIVHVLFTVVVVSLGLSMLSYPPPSKRQ